MRTALAQWTAGYRFQLRAPHQSPQPHQWLSLERSKLTVTARVNASCSDNVGSKH